MKLFTLEWKMIMRGGGKIPKSFKYERERVSIFLNGWMSIIQIRQFYSKLGKRNFFKSNLIKCYVFLCQVIMWEGHGFLIGLIDCLHCLTLLLISKIPVLIHTAV